MTKISFGEERVYFCLPPVAYHPGKSEEELRQGPQRSDAFTGTLSLLS